MQSAEGRLSDHEERLRKIERVTYGLLITGAVIGWGLTQINNIIKIVGAA